MKEEYPTRFHILLWRTLLNGVVHVVLLLVCVKSLTRSLKNISVKHELASSYPLHFYPLNIIPRDILHKICPNVEPLLVRVDRIDRECRVMLCVNQLKGQDVASLYLSTDSDNNINTTREEV